MRMADNTHSVSWYILPSMNNRDMKIMPSFSKFVLTSFLLMIRACNHFFQKKRIMIVRNILADGKRARMIHINYEDIRSMRGYLKK